MATTARSRWQAGWQPPVGSVGGRPRPRSCRRPRVSTRATTEQLLAALDRIDVEGWEGATATGLLTYLRSHVVAPRSPRVGWSGRPRGRPRPAVGRRRGSRWRAATCAPLSGPGRWCGSRCVGPSAEVVSGWFVTGERNGWRWSPSGTATTSSEAIGARRCQAATSLDRLSPTVATWPPSRWRRRLLAPGWRPLCAPWWRRVGSPVRLGQWWRVSR